MKYDLNLLFVLRKAHKEDFVKILSRAELEVFSAEYPRPENMLLGDEAMMEYLVIK